jgi:hypothetical protein
MGENYTIILTKEGDLYSFGKNSNGELGLGFASNSESSILKINFKKVSNIFSGRYHSIIITENEYICNSTTQFKENVCNSRGICLEDSCQCIFGYNESNYCKETSCFGFSSNNLNVCSGNKKL